MPEFAPRGAPDREELARLAADGLTLREMAGALDRSVATCATGSSAGRSAGRTAGDTATTTRRPRRASRSGAALRTVSPVRPRRPRQLSLQALPPAESVGVAAQAEGDAGRGGGRPLCYLRIRSLPGRAPVPPPRSGRQGLCDLAPGPHPQPRESAREARKCILVCANCHAELEAGYRVLEGTLTS